MSRPSGLGRGLSALIPATTVTGTGGEEASDPTDAANWHLLAKCLRLQGHLVPHRITGHALVKHALGHIPRNDRRATCTTLDHHLPGIQTQAPFLPGGTVAGKTVCFQKRPNLVLEINLLWLLGQYGRGPADGRQQHPQQGNSVISQPTRSHVQNSPLELKAEEPGATWFQKSS